MKNIKFFIVGIAFGFVAIKAEIGSWFRIQEMFNFQSFHMYGIICSAIAVGAISYWLMKKLNIKTIEGEQAYIKPKVFTKGTIIGGLIFGMGWALTGACPGPMYAIVGGGVPVMIIGLLSAILGTYVYGNLKNKLPH
jgi:uncharacterized membrane protein YedE/YeeE